MSDISEKYKERIRNVMLSAPWEKSKSVQQKAKRERRALQRRNRAPPKIPTEYYEQKEFVKWLRERKIAHFAVSNELAGEDVDPVRISQMRAIGFSSGVTDIIIVDLSPLNGKPTAIEMKRSDKKNEEKALSDNQKRWRDIFKSKTWNYACCPGYKDAIEKAMSFGYGS